MNTLRATLAAAVLLGVVPGYLSARQVPSLDASQMLADLRVLAHDSMEGRATGSAGNAKAREYIRKSFVRIGLDPVYDDFVQPFTFAVSEGDSMVGSNIVGRVPGTSAEQPYLLVSAHFDHLGVRSGRIFNGADDNASGVAVLLAVARYFAAHPPVHPMLFVAFDAEENGLRGARAFVARPPVDLASLATIVNLDMVSHSDSVLFVVGTHHYPHLRPLVQSVTPPPNVVVRFGHDQPGTRPGDDWTGASDHGPFHMAGVSFLYFGVEDHADYHAPTDDVERINERFFVGAADTILRTLVQLDRHLTEIAARRPR